MRDLFILLGHLLMTVAKPMGPGSARAILPGYFSYRWRRDLQFAMDTQADGFIESHNRANSSARNLKNKC